ncbi:hypothetical protein [Variovorax sp. LARHSF232]
MPTVAYVHSPHSSSSLRRLPDWPPAVASILALFEAARRVRAELRARPSYQPLRGKNLALLMACPPGPESALLQAAAIQLGAQVALVRYSHHADAQARDIEALAGALGRMYDAIDCEFLPALVPQRIARCAGVPVTEGLGGEQHRVCALADLMTLYEHPLPAQAPLSVCLLGDADSPRARVFLTATRDLGFDVLGTDAGREACEDATFVVDATQPARWPLQARGVELDDARRADNHLRLVQAALLAEMGELHG